VTPVALLAQEGSRDPGPVPLFIVVVLGILTVLLIRNMSGRIKRLPRSFDPPGDRAGDAAPQATPPGDSGSAPPADGPDDAGPPPAPGQR
jgi:hypothetical protein